MKLCTYIMRTMLVMGCMLAVNVVYAQHSGHAGLGAQPKQATAAISEKSCRKGAFTDAMALINASVRASIHLAQQSTAKGTAVPLAELDSVLSIAINQASDEYACVRGLLVMGYDKNYADTVKLAIQHAQSRRMSPATISLAKGLLGDLQATGKPTTSAVKKP